MHPNPRGKGFLIRGINHALGRYRNLVSPLSERIREVENMTLLAADIRWEKLGQQKDAHQNSPAAAAKVTAERQSSRLLRQHRVSTASAKSGCPGYDGVKHARLDGWDLEDFQGDRDGGRCAPGS